MTMKPNSLTKSIFFQNSKHPVPDLHDITILSRCCPLLSIILELKTYDKKTKEHILKVLGEIDHFFDTYL